MGPMRSHLSSLTSPNPSSDSASRLLQRLRLLLPTEYSISHNPPQTKQVRLGRTRINWPGCTEEAGPEAGHHWILSDSTNKDVSNRNDSCLVNQSPSPVGVGTNQKSSSDLEEQ